MWVPSPTQTQAALTTFAITITGPMMDVSTPDDCAWCGAEIVNSKPPGSIRGEVFCSVAHRDASARAVKKLRESGANGEEMGHYKGADADAALDAYALDAGSDYATLREEHGEAEATALVRPG